MDNSVVLEIDSDLPLAQCRKLRISSPMITNCLTFDSLSVKSNQQSSCYRVLAQMEPGSSITALPNNCFIIISAMRRSSAPETTFYRMITVQNLQLVSSVTVAIVLSHAPFLSWNTPYLRVLTCVILLMSLHSAITFPALYRYQYLL